MGFDGTQFTVLEVDGIGVFRDSQPVGFTQVLILVIVPDSGHLGLLHSVHCQSQASWTVKYGLNVSC